jgi:hypothetical protein
MMAAAEQRLFNMSAIVAGLAHRLSSCPSSSEVGETRLTSHVSAHKKFEQRICIALLRVRMCSKGFPGKLQLAT